MRRKIVLLTALAIAAVAVVGGLAATAFGPEDGAPAKPSGKETRIRIEPQKDNVACSGDKQAVDVFLDDLRPRPNGLAAFQVTLVYDPSILRVEEPEDAQMNPALASAQTAGGMRAFMPAPTTIDNLEGYVFMGAVGIPQGEPFNAAAQGLDPVARGEPILLFTVNFQTVGEGTSPLTVYRGEEPSPKAGALGVQVVDYAGQVYAPVTITDSSLTVTAGKCTPAPAVTARPTQVLPTPFPTRTPVVVPTPQQVTPVPTVEAGRPDCPDGWAAFNDPDGRFSLCYPSALRGISERSSLTGTAVQLAPPDFATSRPEERVFLLASWRSWSWAQQPGPGALCAGFAQTGEVSRQEGKMTVSAIEASTCLTEVHQIDPGVGVSDRIDYYQLMVEIPLASGGFVLIRGVYGGPDFDASRATLMQMLGGLTVEQ
jgi:hypothetical protein